MLSRLPFKMGGEQNHFSPNSHVTMKIGQHHHKYKRVKLHRGYHYAEFQISSIRSIQENASITVCVQVGNT